MRQLDSYQIFFQICCNFIEYYEAHHIANLLVYKQENSINPINNFNLFLLMPFKNNVPIVIPNKKLLFVLGMIVETLSLKGLTKSQYYLLDLLRFLTYLLHSCNLFNLTEINHQFSLSIVIVI